ncbi:MAG TPA: CHAT domain-containing protein [Streptosporangiaceae bacterium]|nr:CHAT domain-containing protein [Streptosporangiaceae bacterium]
MQIEVHVTSQPSGNYMITARSAVGEVSEMAVPFPFDASGLQAEREKIETAVIQSAMSQKRESTDSESPVRAFGHSLFSFLFHGHIGEHLAASRTQAALSGMPLYLDLAIDAPELAALPWESLYDKERNEFLSLRHYTARYIRMLEPVRPIAVGGAVRILAVMASPEGFDRIDFSEERERLTAALKSSTDTGMVEISWLENTSWRSLELALRSSDYHVLHFIGHGHWSETGGGLLAFHHDDRRAHLVSAENLGLQLADFKSLQLAVLNSCSTARSGFQDVFSSTASVLVRRGLPAAIAMQHRISDLAAASFCQGLYSAIAEKKPVMQAVTMGRREVRYVNKYSLEWLTPVLFIHATDGSLVGGENDTSHVDSSGMPAASVVTRSRPMELITQPSRGARGELRTAGRTLHSLNHDAPVKVMAFGPDGSWIVTGSEDGTARVWEVSSGSQLARLEHDGGVTALAASPDGGRIATGSEDATARVWEIDKDGAETFRARCGEIVHAVAFSPVSGAFAAGSGDATARLWNISTGAELRRMRHDDSVTALLFSEDGLWLATASGRHARLWADGHEYARVMHDLTVSAIALNSTRTWLATGSHDNSVRLWDTRSATHVVRVRHDGWISKVAFSPTSDLLATGSYDQTACIWEMPSGRQVARLKHFGTVRALAFSPAGDVLVTACDDGVARVWSV